MSEAKNDPRIIRGMHRQLEIRQSRLDAGEKPIGWKVGFGAPASLELLNIDAPLVGFMTDASYIDSGATVSAAKWTTPQIEPEIALYIGQDVPAGADRDAARAAVSAIGPIIELADVNSPVTDVEGVLAGNIYHKAVIPGPIDETRAGLRLDGLVGYTTRNGVDQDPVTELQALTGDMVDIVRHVADLLAHFGAALRAGEVIIAGSITPPIRPTTSEDYTFTLGDMQTISIRLEI